LDIKSSSIALQNYFNQQDIKVPVEKQVDSEKFDDSIVENMNHFKMESPLAKKARTCDAFRSRAGITKFIICGKTI